ncbi:MAG: hypothetical protein Q8P92_03540 [Candidatus Daviesbacteria bacterium]|nr:hypothetical protein [Candidatus Daviesbacteria bacterium]
MKFKTKIGFVALTPERKAHIIQHHPIMEDYSVHLKDVLERPKEIRYSNRSDAILEKI